MQEIIEEILKFIFWLFVSILFYFTGQIIITVVTFGAIKPEWKKKEKGAMWWQMFTFYISEIIGFAFWLTVFPLGYDLFFKLTNS